MAKKTDPQIDIGKMERYVCPVCKKTKGTDRAFEICEYCSEPMIPMKEWVRKQARKG